MPIRFRCRHCNQLMGISRRKAGMTVNCPTCHAELVVPQAEAEAHPPPAVEAAPPPGNNPAPLFERSDFEDFLHNPPAEAPPQPLAAVAPSAPPLPSSLALPPRPVGLVLSPTQATILTVAAILLLALAFGAGLLVGHYWVG